MSTLLGMLTGSEAFSGFSPLSSFSTPSGRMVKGAILAVLRPFMSGSDEEGDSLVNTDLNSQSRI